MERIFRTTGFLEAASFLILLGISMPLKYYFGIAAATKIPGLVHGILFLIYVALATQLAGERQWPKKKLLLAYLASVLPFGTLVFDRKFLGNKT